MVPTNTAAGEMLRAPKTCSDIDRMYQFMCKGSRVTLDSRFALEYTRPDIAHLLSEVKDAALPAVQTPRRTDTRYESEGFIELLTHIRCMPECHHTGSASSGLPRTAKRAVLEHKHARLAGRH